MMVVPNRKSGIQTLSPYDEEITFEGMRKVLGGNGPGTPDGLAPYAMGAFDFFTEDIGTMLGADATANERLEAAAFTFIKPAKMYDTAHDDDAWKTGEKAKDAGKGTGNAASKRRVVDGKKEYNVNGKWLTDNQFSALRQKAVRQAWKAEKELIDKTGRGSRDWTPDELEELMTTGKVKGYEGQHMKSANEYPDFAGDPDNIQFLKGRTMDVNEHLDAHGGSYHNPTNGYYDPNTDVMIDFDDKVPWK